MYLLKSSYYTGQSLIPVNWSIALTVTDDNVTVCQWSNIKLRYTCLALKPIIQRPQSCLYTRVPLERKIGRLGPQ